MIYKMHGRFWLAALLTFAGALSAASGESTSQCGAASAPTSSDYLVLASMADSQHPISMLSSAPLPVDLEVAVQLN
ncbi:MAG: hypothetical protein ABI356_05310 [Steroidobacteraceae bacterium]